MTQVEDFWNIKKTNQTYNFRRIIKYIASGICKSSESIRFQYNGDTYSVEFDLYLQSNLVDQKTTYDHAEIDFVILTKDEQTNVYYPDQLSEADLTNMNDPVSKAVRAINYAIVELFNKTVKSCDYL